MSEQNNGSCSAESCSSRPSAGTCSSKKVDMRIAPNEYTHVKKVIGYLG